MVSFLALLHMDLLVTETFLQILASNVQVRSVKGRDREDIPAPSTRIYVSSSVYEVFNCVVMVTNEGPNE